MNILRSPNIARAVAPLSAAALSLAGMSLAHAGSPDHSHQARIHKLEHDAYQDCDYETKSKRAPDDQPDYLGYLAYITCQNPHERLGITAEVVYEQPNGDVFYLHGHGEIHPKLDPPSGQRGATALVETLFPKSYLIHLRKKGDRLSLWVDYEADPPKPSKLSGSNYGLFGAKITDKDLGIDSKHQPKPTDIPSQRSPAHDTLQPIQ